MPDEEGQRHREMSAKPQPGSALVQSLRQSPGPAQASAAMR